MPSVSLQGMVGEVKMFAGATPPGGWLQCDGSEISRTTYANLFNVIGTTYGSTSGTTFKLPDFRGRSPMGTGDAPDLAARSLGDKIGEENHTLDVGEMPGHTHSHDAMGLYSLSASSGTLTLSPGGVMRTGFPGTIITNSTGGGGAHNTIHPVLCVNFIIKY